MNYPKLTAAQKRVINSHGVTFLGMDEKGRPVVEKKETWGDSMVSWAITKNGEPTEISGWLV